MVTDVSENVPPPAYQSEVDNDVHDHTALQPKRPRSADNTIDIPRHRWEDNIKMNVNEIGCEGLVWFRLVQGKFNGEVCKYSN